MNLKQAVILDLGNLYDENLPFSGGTLQLQPSADDSYHYYFNAIVPEPGIELSVERLAVISSLISQEMPLPNLIARIYKDYENKSLNCYQSGRNYRPSAC